MNEVADRCRCGEPLTAFDTKVGWYWCLSCDYKAL